MKILGLSNYVDQVFIPDKIETRNGNREIGNEKLFSLFYLSFLASHLQLETQYIVKLEGLSYRIERILG